MTQNHLLETFPCDKYDLLSREEAIILYKGEQSIRKQLEAEVHRLSRLHDETKQRALLLEGLYVTIKNKFFGKSSEKSPKNPSGENEGNKTPLKRVLLPSERYPNAPLIEREVTLDVLPNCNACGSTMTDSGMTEDSEFLTAIPRQILVVRQKRHTYRCGCCHGDLQTAPNLPRITPGSAYSDEMAIDVAMSKYCDLIPVERYSAMAAREGVKGIPSQSLIQTTHDLADFSEGAYDKLKAEITSAEVLHADETPHRMLEGDKKSNWNLWGFSTPQTSYFELHDTRSGDVASTLLRDSACRFLVSDVFSGYAKAVRETNEYRQAKGHSLIRNVYCNAHARRKFKEALDRFTEAEYFIERYAKIYHLESLAKGTTPDEVAAYRLQMRPHFQEMLDRAMYWTVEFPDQSSMGKAMSYFLKNYDSLTCFLKSSTLPIDNNAQERQMRSPVIGRKTWYGTHSVRGAKTAAVLFSLVESCKLNRVNPREYFRKLVEALHSKQDTFTPAEYKNWPASTG